MNGHPTAEWAAREAYGRVLARLAARSGDLAAAEDALADALEAALRQWPVEGVPETPAAWLFAVARRRLQDGWRRAAVRQRAEERLLAEMSAESPPPPEGAGAWPDERLALLFACAHPAVDAGVRAPLLLQAVFGLDAARIASAVCVAPKTLGQRLWRAKVRLRDEGVLLAEPPASERPARLGAVLEAIYAAYGAGWADLHVDDAHTRGLAPEALRLARLLVELLPGEAEAEGLLALLLFAEARASARRGGDGGYVPLSEQDTRSWNRTLLAEAEGTLTSAFRRGRIGPYQLEAAIQSAHVYGALSGRPDHGALRTLYDGLVRLAPTLGAHVGRAAALTRAGDPEAALGALDALPAAAVVAYQPYWAVRARVLADLARPVEADAAYARAVGLSEDPAVRAFLARERARLG